jgi:hypothetical protein
VALIGTLSDNFDDGVQAAAWSATHTANGATVAETGGRMVLTIPSNAGGANGAYKTGTAYDLTGSAASLQVYQYPSGFPNSNGVEASFLAQLDGNNWVRFQVTRDGLRAQRSLAGTVTTTTVPHDPLLHRFWRLRESGGTVFWETSREGSEWRTLRATAPGFAVTALTFEFGGLAPASVDGGTVRFDEFNTGAVTVRAGGRVGATATRGYGAVPFQSTTHVADLYTNGVRYGTVELGWDLAEPTTEGTYSDTYLDTTKAIIDALVAQGFRVVFSFATYYAPAWAKSREPFVNQYGEAWSGGANLIWNASLRTAAQNCISHFVTRFGGSTFLNNLWAVRIGSGTDTELLYPNLDYYGATTTQTSFGAYSTSAAAAYDAEIPTAKNGSTYFKPGDTGFTTAQGAAFYAWYLDHLADAGNWQMAYWRGLGFAGRFLIVAPGKTTAADVSDYAALTAARFAGSQFANRGNVWWQVARRLRRDPLLVWYCSSFAENDPFADDVSTFINNRSSSAQHRRWGLALGAAAFGENPDGNATPTDMDRAFGFLKSLGYDGLLWIREPYLYDGGVSSHASVADYRTRMAAAEPVATAVSPTAPVGLVWSDEFDTLSLTTDAAPSSGVWRTRGYESGGTLATGYTDFAGTSWNTSPVQHPAHTPFSVAGSVLTVKAKRTPIEVTNVAGALWMGGYLVTNHLNTAPLRWRFGYFEWRARLPNPARGMFPALWLFNNIAGRSDGKEGAEIDMLEVFGTASGMPWASGWHNNPTPGVSGNAGTFADDTAGWHRYGVEWTATAIRYYKDGIQKAELTGTNATWFATADLGVRIDYVMDPSWEPLGSALRSTSSDPPLGTEPRLEVDYVRVFSAKPSPFPTGSDDPLAGGGVVAPAANGDAYSALVLASAPWAYYRLNESGGAVMYDASGNGRHGALNAPLTYGTTGLLAGSTDPATTFGSTGYGALSGGSAGVATTTTWTVSGIVTTVASSSGDHKGYFGCRTFGDGDCYLLHLQDTSNVEARFTNSSGTQHTLTVAVAMNARTHVHLVYDGSTFKCYVNGVLGNLAAGGTQNATMAASGQITNSSLAFEVGRVIDKYSATAVDEVAIYRTALTASQVANQYATGSVALSGPTGLTATAGAGRIDLAWTDNSPDENGFELEWSPTGTGGWLPLATVAANVRTYSDTNLTPGTARYYRVRAYKTV